MNAAAPDSAPAPAPEPDLGLGLDPEAVQLATTAAPLYLLNILLLPGFAFLGLLWLYAKHRASPCALVQCHLRQALRASICADPRAGGQAVLLSLDWRPAQIRGNIMKAKKHIGLPRMPNGLP